MTPWTAKELAAIDAAVTAGKVQRLPSPCAFSGGRFDRLFLGGVELAGETERRRLQFGRLDLQRLERQVARGKVV